MKKRNFWVVGVLFIMPLVFYIFLLTGTNNFAKLPVLTENVQDVNHFNYPSKDTVTLKGNISILCFFGDDLDAVKSNALNLNEKIYKHFYKFKDFQFVAVLPEGTQPQSDALLKRLGVVTDMRKWKSVYGSREEIETLFNSLKTTLTINEHSYSPYAFIIDKDQNLRGRIDDDDTAGILYGYNAETVAPIHNKMVDDVKVIVAEYRMALKKNKRKI
ncbi:hypothetical protein MWU59_00375 [Flavobacteriaceae bacterium F08102]|nr:hypothetical protein [Flavobacteriaceae bacterium F08102]